MSASIPEVPACFNLADYYLFDRLREGLGARPAIAFGARTYSYAEVAERADRLRCHLQARRLPSESRVYLVLPDTPAFAWTIFGVLAAGAIVTLGNPESSAEDLHRVLDYVRARVLVTTPAVLTKLHARLPSLPELVEVLLVPEVPTGGDCEERIADPQLEGGAIAVLELTAALAAIGSTRPPRPTVHRDDHAIWLFTSGSTGSPKAAMHSHRDFAFNTERYALRTVGYQPGDVAVSVPRLFFGYATGTNLFFPFRVGGTVGLFVERPTPESLARAIVTYRPQIVTNVPTMMGKLLDYDEQLAEEGQPRLDFSSVRFFLSAGEALPEALLQRFTQRFAAEVYDGIGSAEMFHIYCSNRPGEIVPGTLGRAVDGYELRVLPEDATGAGTPPVATGEIGVLWVRGDSVAHGYYQDRERSWRTFHGHWCRTGDLFSLDERGYLRFAGRADDLLKVGGQWVAPIEVEACLLGHADVSLAAVIGHDDEGLVKPKAFVVVRQEASFRTADAGARAAFVAELQAHCQARLAKHKYPRWIEFVDDLPRNDRGKIDRRALASRSAS